MLEHINPEMVCQITGCIREFQAKEEVVLPDVPDNPTDDWALQVLADHTDDLTYSEAKCTIDDLESDQQAALVALMWIGRGDFDADDWDSAYREAADRWTPRTAEYVLATPLSADYLDEALSQMGYSCDEGY